MIRTLVHGIGSLFPHMSKTTKACLIIALIIVGLIVSVAVPLLI